MRNSFRILFYVKRKETLKNGRMPIMCKISVNGRFCTFSTSLSAACRQWNARSKRLTGRSYEARRVNALLDRIHYDVYGAYVEALRRPAETTPQAVRRIYLGQREETAGIVEFFRRHNDDFAQMVGVSRSASTLYKYRYVCRHLENYITDRYGRSDIPMTCIDRAFVRDFHRWLSDTVKCGVNTIWIYMIAFKHVMLQAVCAGFIDRNPFTGYKLHSRSPCRNFLMTDELRRLLSVEPASASHAQVLDAFIFSCFTGLSYSDIKRLSMADVVVRGNRYYVSTRRTKTGEPVDVPLLRLPYMLVMKHRRGDARTPLFDLPSNSWCNRVLKRAVCEAGINKRLSFHSARHTFATTVTLANGVPIEAVSRMLGHTDIKTTQIYAKVLQSSVAAEMSRVSKSIESRYAIPSRLLAANAPSAADGAESKESTLRAAPQLRTHDK